MPDMNYQCFEIYMGNLVDLFGIFHPNLIGAIRNVHGKDTVKVHVSSLEIASEEVQD